MRVLLALGLVGVLASLWGCTEPIVLHTYVDPPTGHVPYAARIVCTALPGSYKYELPDGSTTTTDASQLAVTVDRLAWTARVTWTDGHDMRVETAEAHGTNERPLILVPRLNGDAYLWKLQPYMQTLVDFGHHAAGPSGPESGVVYDDTWRIVEIRVEAEEKRVCDAPMQDSVYTPPWEPGVFHTLYKGRLVDHACLVYPLLTMETDPNGLPYSPEPFEGYLCDRAIERDVLDEVRFPEQSAQITVTVEDNWGRLTTASFTVPVGGLPGFSFYDDFEDDDFFVSAPSTVYYYPPDCPQVCSLPRSGRIYFASQENAENAGKKRSEGCFGY